VGPQATSQGDASAGERPGRAGRRGRHRHPPLAVTTEALEFVPVANVVVLVGRMGRTPTTAAERAGELIRFGGAEQIAVALTDTGSARLRRNSYYDYYRDKGDVQTGATSTSRSGSKAAKRRRASSSTRGESAAAATEVTSVTDRLEPVPSGGDHVRPTC
jgi:hypothetical protein